MFSSKPRQTRGTQPKRIYFFGFQANLLSSKPRPRKKADQANTKGTCTHLLKHGRILESMAPWHHSLFGRLLSARPGRATDRWHGRISEAHWMAEASEPLSLSLCAFFFETHFNLGKKGETRQRKTADLLFGFVYPPSFLRCSRGPNCKPSFLGDLWGIS